MTSHPAPHDASHPRDPSATSGLRLTPDPGLRRLAGGRTLLGGSPYRVLRLTDAGARLVAGWFDGALVRDVPQHQRLAARLLRHGMAHPAYAHTRYTADDVTAVIPVRDEHPGRLAELTSRLGELSATLLVDDGSALPLPAATVRHSVPQGPAAARNSGWRLAKTELVAFLDADVLPEDGWLEPLLRHFEDPDVLAVAPRVRSRPGPSALARYEERRSPLDLGPSPAPVRPASVVSYVPSAALLVRASALTEQRGFDERLRFGEDVDLIWRLAGSGGQIRYEPASTVRHAPRDSWPRWLKQRFDYGTSAAPLALRHGKAVAPVRASPWSFLCWAALSAGRPGVAALTAATTAALLPRKLSRAGVPASDSLELAFRGHLGLGRVLADATTRAWWPLAVPALAATRQGRLLLVGAFGRHAVDWYQQRPPLDLPHWLTARIADDLAYGAGVWWGALRHRTTAPLRPDISEWPGRDGVSYS